MGGLRSCVTIAMVAVAASTAIGWAPPPVVPPMTPSVPGWPAPARILSECAPTAALRADSAQRSVVPRSLVDVHAVGAAVRQVAGDAAAVVFDRATGELVLAEEPDRPFQSASVVKLLIALDVLAAAPPDESTAARLRSMLSTSSDAQASAFWVAGGGGAIVRREVAALGLAATVAPRTDRLWGYTTITARDVLAVYRHIMDRLPMPDRELILSALRAAPRVAADGVDQYFGIPDGLSGLPWAVKQGWSSGQGVVAIHSTGLVGAGDRFIVVLLTEQHAGVGWSNAMRLATDAARVLNPLLA